MGRNKKRNHHHIGNGVGNEQEELKQAPHSFVVHHGKVGRYTKDLTMDFRKLMEPFTASKLKMKNNVIKDLVSVAGFLNVSHLCLFTQSELSTYLRLARLPRGPTLTFRVGDYVLARDVLSALKRQVTYAKQFQHSPLLILNNFKGEGIHLKLMASMFQNIFPSLNINKVKLNSVRRCVLLSYNSDVETVDLRHYTIRIAPVCLSRPIKKLVESRLPNLARYDDVAEYFDNGVNLTDSEIEDDPASHIILPQLVSSRGNIKSHKSAIRLVELGPRLTLQLIKVEEGLMDGEVMYHKLIDKTKEEKLIITLKRDSKKKMKEKRKKIQTKNVKRNEDEKEAHKIKSMAGIKRKRAERECGTNNEDDAREWYKKRLMENPDVKGKKRIRMK